MKSKIIQFGVLGVLAVVSFTASFLVTQHVTAPPPEGLLLSTQDEKIPVDPDALLLNSMAQATGDKMTPKERVITQLQHRETDVVPYSRLGFDEDVARRIDDHYGSPDWRDRGRSRINIGYRHCRHHECAHCHNHCGWSGYCFGNG